MKQKRMNREFELRPAVFYKKLFGGDIKGKEADKEEESKMLEFWRNLWGKVEGKQVKEERAKGKGAKRAKVTKKKKFQRSLD